MTTTIITASAVRVGDVAVSGSGACANVIGVTRSANGRVGILLDAGWSNGWDWGTPWAPWRIVGERDALEGRP